MSAKMSTVGFTLTEKRHGPHDPQRLGFWWLEKADTHYGFEMAINDNHPMMVADQLEQMAEAIRRKHREHRKPNLPRSR